MDAKQRGDGRSRLLHTCQRGTVRMIKSGKTKQAVKLDEVRWAFILHRSYILIDYVIEGKKS